MNSGGVVFIAIFDTSKSENITKEGAVVIKIASSRMATQSERLGYEFARWLGVRTPQVCIFITIQYSHSHVSNLNLLIANMSKF